MRYTGERLIIGDKECDEDSDIYQEHIERYKFAAEFVQGRVLDIACGSGYGSKMLADRAEEVWGGDISEEAIKIAKEKYSGENVHFRLMDASELPFDNNYFDLVVSFETIEHLKDSEKFVAEIKRVLKPGGRLILSTPDKRVTKKLGVENKFHIKEFGTKEIKELLLNNNFKDIKFFGQRPVKKVSKLLLIYKIYKKIKLLNFLDKIISRRVKEKIVKEMESLEHDFKINRLDPPSPRLPPSPKWLRRPSRRAREEYLYIIVIGIRN